VLEGAPKRQVAQKYAVSDCAVYRHFRNGHVTKELAKAHEAEELAHGDSIFDQLKELRDKTTGILDRAEKKGQNSLMLGAIRELRGIIELAAKIQGQMPPEVSVNVLTNPSFIQMRTVIMQALSSFPEARLKVAEVLRNVEDSADVS
jgi:hypothetical protein